MSTEPLDRLGPSRPCERCGAELFELLDGIDACPGCGIRLDPVRRDSERLAELLGDVERFLGRFVTFTSDAQAVAVTLWAAHVYAIDAAPSAAYLRITSVTEESGKTTLLEVLEQLLGDRCLNLVSASPAFVFRRRDKVGPVALLLDEIDQTLKDRKDDGARDLLALVNAGYRRSAKVGRTVGRDHEGRYFRALGPAAIAGLGSLAATTESRCVPIQLERKPRGSGERWLPFLVEEEAAAIADRFAAWASEETIGGLRAARPQIPAALRDRHAEAWWSLLAIADAAGGPWPEMARSAAVSLHAERDAEASMSVAVLLLAHVRQIVEASELERIPTADLVGALVEFGEGPWARWWASDVDRASRGEEHALDKAGAALASLLKPFRRSDGQPLKPRAIRMPDGRTLRGYLVADFADAFGRYLGSPGATGATGATGLASSVAPVAAVAPPEGSEDPWASYRPQGEPEPGWVRIQRETGEGPETDEARAFARVKAMLGATEARDDLGSTP